MWRVHFVQLLYIASGCVRRYKNECIYNNSEQYFKENYDGVKKLSLNYQW